MKKYHSYYDTVCDYVQPVFGALLVALFFVMAMAVPALANQGTPSSSGSVLNILFLGIIAYFLVRMFRRRSGGGREDNTRPGKWNPKEQDEKEKGRVIRPMDRHEAARQMWGNLSSDKPEATTPTAAPQIDGAFNEAEFLEGAKLFFSRFQEARDGKDFEQLRGFLSDEVYADAVVAAQADHTRGRTEIMLLNARIMEVKSENGRTFTTVFYDGQIRKGESGEQPEHIRVVWEFSRDDEAENGLWTLEQINKVDQ